MTLKLSKDGKSVYSDNILDLSLDADKDMFYVQKNIDIELNLPAETVAAYGSSSHSSSVDIGTNNVLLFFPQVFAVYSPGVPSSPFDLTDKPYAMEDEGIQRTNYYVYLKPPYLVLKADRYNDDSSDYTFAAETVTVKVWILIPVLD